MGERREADPNDWRTWRRDGDRLIPPPGTTASQSVAAVCAFSAARWGIDPDRHGKDRRNGLRVLRKVEGGYEQISFGRVVNGRAVEIRVRGGCRIPSVG